MKIPVTTSVTLAALITLTWGTSTHAALTQIDTPAPPAAKAHPASPKKFDVVAFQSSNEAQMLHRAYHILATGDHDYKGHRAHAMHAVEAAAKLLGMELRGDDRDKTPQPLSDERLQEAEGLINQVISSAEVKDQKHIVNHLNEAVRQINIALTIR